MAIAAAVPTIMFINASAEEYRQRFVHVGERARGALRRPTVRGRMWSRLPRFSASLPGSPGCRRFAESAGQQRLDDEQRKH